MPSPSVTLRLADGSRRVVGPETIVGRSPVAGLHVDDPRVSAVHAEISWRAEGFVLLARGGRVLVDGRGARAVVLRVGQRITLAPGLDVEVLAIEEGAAVVVPPTAGRESLRFVVGPGYVRVHRGSDAEPAVELGGVPGRILSEALAQADRGVPWGRLAEATWPDDAAVRASPGWTEVDERRLRNRWDQALASARRLLEDLGRQELLVQRQGIVFVELGPLDVVEAA